MKKLFSFLAVCLLIALLTACNAPQKASQNTTPSSSETIPPETSTPTQPPHVCQAGESFAMDRYKHWNTCSCGEKMNEEAHTLENQVCTVCKATISKDEIQRLHYLWLTDEQDNVIRTQCYSGDRLLQTYTFDYTYGEDGQVLGKASFANGILYASSTWDENGNLLTDSKYEDGQKTDFYNYEYTFHPDGQIATLLIKNNDVPASKSVLDQYGRVLEQVIYSQLAEVKTCYSYDNNGNLAQTLQYTNDVLTTKGIYGLNGKKPYLKEDYAYDAEGNYTHTKYNAVGQTISIRTYTPAGELLDISDRFHVENCTDLLGGWSGEMVIDSSMLGMDIPGFQLKAQVYMHLDENGLMRMIFAIDEDEYRQILKEVTYETLRDYFGRERSQDELEILSLAEYGKGINKYVENYVNGLNVNGFIYHEFFYFYYVENGKIYSADSWKSRVEVSDFILAGDMLTLSDPNFGLSITMTRGGTVPPPPSAKTEADYSFNPEACAPLFGVWEGTFTKSDTDFPELSVEVTIRLTFLEDGRVLVQKTYDPKKYYEYKVALYMNHTYQSYEYSYNFTKEQTEEEFLRQHGVSLREYAEAMMLPLSNLLPKDNYTAYYLCTIPGWDGTTEERLVIGYTSTSYILTEDTLTLSNRKAVFTKIG